MVRTSPRDLLRLDAIPPRAPADRAAAWPAAEAVRLEVVTSDHGLDGLEGAWQELTDQADVTVFQTYDWLRAWWAEFGAGRELRCLVFRAGERLVGIAPLLQEPFTVARLPVAVRWRFLGSPHSSYHDVIVRPGYESAVLERFAVHLGETADRWDFLDVDAARDDSLVLARLPEVLRSHGIDCHRYQANVCPEVPLPPTWELFLQRLGPNSRSNFRRKQRRLWAHFAAEVELYQEPGDDLPAAVEEFARIHEERWRSLGYPSAVKDRAFYVDLARRFARRGWLQLSFLKADGLRVAVSFDFRYKARLYSYLAHAHGPAEVMKLSPGFVLMCLAAQRGIADGMTAYDLLSGAESYKYERLKAVDRPVSFLRLASPRRSAVRRRIVTTGELAGKVGHRLRREFYDLRRYRLTQHASTGAVCRAAFGRARELGRLGVAHLLRRG